MACASLDEFRKIHNHQLKSIDFPTNLVQSLYNALNGDEVNPSRFEDVLTIKTLQSSRPFLLSNKEIPKNSCFYLIDHIWTSDGSSKCAHHLEKSSELAEKLRQMFNLPELGNVEDCYDFTSQVDIVKQICNCTLDQAGKALDEYNGKIIESMEKCLDKETQDLPEKSDTTNESVNYEEFVAGLKTTGNMPEDASEDFLRKMYENFNKDKKGCGTTLKYNWEDEGDVVTVYVPIPLGAHKRAIKSTLTSTKWRLVVNDKELINDELFHTVKSDDSYWSIEKPGMLCMTFEKVMENQTWELLLKNESKLSATSIVQTAWAERKFKEIYHNDLLDTMWKFNQMYSLSPQTGEARTPQWYVMDKLGSALTHSNHPNFKCSPFFYSTLGRAYTIIWPIKDIKQGEMCTRNFIPQIVANETLDICKVRLKAYTEKKICGKQDDVDEKETLSTIDDVNVETMSTKAVQKSEESKTVFLGEYAKILDQTVAAKLHVKVGENNTDTAMSLIPLNKTSINIDGDILPASEMIANIEYWQNYLTYRVGKVDWYNFSHILPAGLVDFNKEFERTNLMQYWIVKANDKRSLQMETFVTSHFARIVRVSEVGSIAVSKYISNQIPFRDHLVTLSYPVFISPATKSAFIYKEPCMRFSKEKVLDDGTVYEYNNDSTVTESMTSLVSTHASDAYADMKVAMNKILLKQDPDKGWAYVEQQIHKIVGKVGKILAEDIRIPQSGDKITYVICNVDIVIDDELKPRVIGIKGEGTLTNKQCLSDALTVALGGEKQTFLQVH